MAPVVALVAGVSFALVFGTIGVLFAVPLALVTMILVGKLYIEDGLGQKYHGPGATA
jgi:predicted PurR-regulated permease PerM